MHATDDPAPMPPLLKSGLLCLIFVAVIVIGAAPLSMWLVAPTSDTGPATAFPAPVTRTASVAVPGPSTSTTTASPAPPAASDLAGGAPAGAVTPLASTARPPAPAAGCAAALTYLSTHAAPGFQSICPGDADGAQALTCFGHAPCAPGQRMIVIADPCPAAYMNEAHNSWVLLHNAVGTPIPGGNSTIDPFGYCR
jgi:hypothetical protein